MTDIPILAPIKTVSISTRVPVDLAEAIETLAIESGNTRSQLMGWILANYIKEVNDKKTARDLSFLSK